MALFELNQVLIVLINGLGILLGIIVFSQNVRAIVNRLFLAMIIFMLLWVNFAYIPRIIAHENPELALTFLKIAWFVTPLFFTFLYFLAIHLTESQTKYRFLHLSIGLIGLGTGILTGFTNFVVSSVGFVGDAVRINYGIAMWPFLMATTIIIFATIFITYRGYFRLTARKKQQLQYFIAGLSIFYVANLIFNITLPIFFDIVRWYWMGDYSTLIVLGLTGYAIASRELFGIRVVLTSIIVVLIATLLAVDTIVYTQILSVQLAKSITLIIFIYFGYMLIQSIQREVRQREELEELTYKLERANVELKRLDKAKSEFVSIASHQLRTPLTAIKGYLSLVMEGSYGKITKKMVHPMQNMYESNERLIKLVNDLLNMSRLESGRLKFEPEPSDLKEMSESVIKELDIKASQKGLKLGLQASPTFPTVEVDKEKMRNIILNLVDNAIRYTPKGSITVHLDDKHPKIKQGKQVLVSVVDTGAGMDKEDLDKVFASFTRGKAAKLNTEGSGLGLYIAKEFASMHKGKIWAESEGKGKGSAFRILVPIKAQASAAEQKYTPST